MMELNREDVIKALECCANEGFQDCENCPLNIPHQPCSKVKLPRISLSLIKELTEENARYKRYYFNHEYDQWAAEIKSDTVQQMYDKINATFWRVYSADNDHFILLQQSELDQIAKEILEEENNV